MLTCTAYNRQHLIETARVDRDKVHVLYHGLRIPRQPATGRAERAPGPLEILTVGRWSEKKGFLDLIEALALVRDQGVPFRLQIIAGDGSPAYERRVRETIAARALDDRVRISDWLPSEGVEAAMRASDLFVLPCIRPANGAMDGIPNVLIEALSVGLPVVATRLSGIPELIRHGETGLLVNERDPQGLAETLIWCATHMRRHDPACRARAASSSSARSTSRKPSRRSSGISRPRSPPDAQSETRRLPGPARPPVIYTWNAPCQAQRGGRSDSFPLHADRRSRRHCDAGRPCADVGSDRRGRGAGDRAPPAA